MGSLKIKIPGVGWVTIPRGPRGLTGDTGPANSLAIGTVTTGAPGSNASANIFGTPPSQTLDLTIPQGATGAAGTGSPVGTISPYAGFSAPSSHAFCDGSAVSRTTYATLFGVVQFGITGTRTSGSASVTSVSASDIAKLAIGMAVEGAGIQTGTTVSTIGSTSFTMSKTASSSGTTSITVLPYGGGDSSTTFNLPDLRVRIPVGAGSGRTAGSTERVAEASRAALHGHNHTHGASGSSDSQAPLTMSGYNTGFSGSHSHTVNSHTHSISNPNGGTVNAGTAATLAAASGLATHTHGGATGSASPGTDASSDHSHSIPAMNTVSHAHTITVSVGYTDSGDHPYAALNYIIKVA